jgi:hypothetical protein
MRIVLMIVLALYSLGATAQDSSKDSRALCEKGDLEACMNHAYYREFEAEPKPFPKSGLKLLKSACKKEDARACVGLGSVLRRGSKPDLKSAKEAFQKACDIAQSPKSQSALGSGIESTLTGKSTLPGACVSVMEVGCEMEGRDACKAWYAEAIKSCPRQCATPCDHVGLGGKPCCKAWSSECERSSAMINAKLKTVGKSIMDSCFGDSEKRPRVVRVELYVTQSRVLWSDIQLGEEHEKEAACIRAEIKKLSLGRLPAPTQTRVMMR